MKSKELRKEKRVLASILPEKYKKFDILLANEVVESANTVDASLSGFGFESTADPSNFVVGKRIVMYPFDSDKPVYGKVIFTKQNHKSVRVGVQLMEFGGYTRYQQELQSLMSQIEDEAVAVADR